MFPPRSVTELQRFPCMINYLEKFIPNLAEHTAPLCKLLKRDVGFELQKPQLDAIENLKTLVTSAPCKKIMIQIYHPVQEPMPVQLD